MEKTMITEEQFKALPEFKVYVTTYAAWERGEVTIEAVHATYELLCKASQKANKGHDDWARYFVGPDWNKTMVIGTKRAAKISYELGCTAVDRDGAVFCATITNGIGGSPILVRMHK